LVDYEEGVLALHAAVPGRVVEVPVIENAEVRSGAVLLRIDDEAARASVEEAEASLEAAEATYAEAQKRPRQRELLLSQQIGAVAAAQHELAAARLAAQRKEELAQKDLLNRKEADAATEQAKKAEAALKAEQAKLDLLALQDPGQAVKRAEADVRAKMALVDRARRTLLDHTLLAPSDGTVLRVLTSSGELTGPQTRQPALLFGPDKPLIVRAEVTQEFAGHVVVNQRAELQEDTVNGGPVWRGRVIRLARWFAQGRMISPDTLAYQDVRTLEFIIQLEPGQSKPRLGQRMRVKLFTE
jgi:multidrug resistance efflux pump